MRGPFREPGAWQSRHISFAGFRSCALFSVPWTSWQLKQVTPRRYITLWTKSFPCIRFLCAVPSGKCVNVCLAQFVIFELPVILQLRVPCG